MSCCLQGAGQVGNVIVGMYTCRQSYGSSSGVQTAPEGAAADPTRPQISPAGSRPVARLTSARATCYCSITEAVAIPAGWKNPRDCEGDGVNIDSWVEVGTENFIPHPPCRSSFPDRQLDSFGLTTVGQKTHTQSSQQVAKKGGEGQSRSTPSTEITPANTSRLFASPEGSRGWPSGPGRDYYQSARGIWRPTA